MPFLATIMILLNDLFRPRWREVRRTDTWSYQLSASGRRRAVRISMRDKGCDITWLATGAFARPMRELAGL